MKTYDVIVIGGGHAGCEAAMAAQSFSLQWILLAWQECPAIRQSAELPRVR